MWTLFWDMHSGGGCKEEPYDKIYIEASREDAIKIFYGKFGHNPNRVTCTCCGEDYAIDEYATLAAASAYHRNCDYDGEKYLEQPSKDIFREPYQTVVKYVKSSNVLVIKKKDIKKEWLKLEVPTEGYIWVDND